MTALFDTWVTGGLQKLLLLIGEIHKSGANRVRKQVWVFASSGMVLSADYACQPRGFTVEFKSPSNGDIPAACGPNSTQQSLVT